ncbi:MAG: bifunctional folylpolyglutamate synthase/dihydrofolate synthase [Planctomycetes bacterium]|nr:bifunctional folylpolyglutamate synthase/dihydrofolate synthase [Planctomycetota bacterium]
MDMKTSSERSVGGASTRAGASARVDKVDVPPGLNGLVEGAGTGEIVLTSADITDFASAEAYLDQRVNVERMRSTRLPPGVFKLDRMHALMAALGNPERTYKSVHIAGSKGKGSVTEMVASCMGECGYVTGVYMSPHLTSVRERIRLGREQISERDFAVRLRRAAEAGEQIAKDHGEPTFFELVTAVAFIHFAEEAVDLAVIEVGLGGRLDATNVLHPSSIAATAVTAIQLEHTDLLGDTLEKIAAEKAGIFKPGVPAFTFEQPEPILSVLAERAISAGTTLTVLGKDTEFSHRFESDKEHGPHSRVSMVTKENAFEHFAVPLKGEHQSFNCGLALALVDCLSTHKFATPARLVAAGLERTPNYGRFEIVAERPRIVVDGAHTPESVKGAVGAVGLHLRVDSTIIIFGCAADKNVSGMIAQLARGADKVIFTKARGNTRSADPKELARQYEQLTGTAAQVGATVADAIELAKRAAQRDDLILITGSFYVAGEAKSLLKK